MPQRSNGPPLGAAQSCEGVLVLSITKSALDHLLLSQNKAHLPPHTQSFDADNRGRAGGIERRLAGPCAKRPYIRALFQSLGSEGMW